MQTPEHLIPASSFGPGRGAGHPTYSAGRAPCACAEGHATQSTHGFFGRARADWREENGITGDTQTVEQAGECGAAAHERIYPHCSAACIEEQLKIGHDEMEIDPEEEIGIVDDEGVLEDVARMEAELMVP